MLPNAPANAPAPPGGAPQGGDVKSQLLQALQAMIKVAEQNGVDFMSLVREAMQGGGGSPPPPPPPPM